MRDLEADIQAALVRGRSSLRLHDVMMEIFSGDVRVWIGVHMSASARVTKAGDAVEILHCSGKWDDKEAVWMLDGLKAYAEECGLPWRWAGRLSWVRFLKTKGMI